MSAYGPAYPVAGGAAAAASAVEPPAPTSQATASGVNFTAKTFAAFTDTGSVIASYAAVTTNADGSASWSGSGLGAYTATSAAGNSGTLSLNALNAAGDIVATAVHTYDRTGRDEHRARSHGRSWLGRGYGRVRGSDAISWGDYLRG